MYMVYIIHIHIPTGMLGYIHITHVYMDMYIHIDICVLCVCVCSPLTKQLKKPNKEPYFVLYPPNKIHQPIVTRLSAHCFFHTVGNTEG